MKPCCCRGHLCFPNAIFFSVHEQMTKDTTNEINSQECFKYVVCSCNILISISLAQVPYHSLNFFFVKWKGIGQKVLPTPLPKIDLFNCLRIGNSVVACIFQSIATRHMANKTLSLARFSLQSWLMKIKRFPKEILLPRIKICIWIEVHLSTDLLKMTSSGL